MLSFSDILKDLKKVLMNPRLALKTIAIFTLLAFTAQQSIAATPSIIPFEPIHENFGSISIPEELGQVKFSEIPAGKPVIVHIEDAHGNTDGQKKIQALLDHLTDKYGFDLIFLEGAEGKLDAGMLTLFPDRARNASVADILLRHAHLTAVERFLLDREWDPERRGAVEVFGIEDPRLYKKDLRFFKRVKRAGGRSREILDKWRSEIGMLQSRHFTGELLDFVREWQKSYEGNTELLRFVSILEKAAKDHLVVDLSDPKNQDDYPSLLRVLKMRGIEAELDLTKAESEKRVFAESMKGRVDPEILRQIAAGPAEKRQRPLRRLLERVDPAALERFPDFARSLRYQIWKEEVRSAELFTEQDALSEKIFERLAVTSDQKKILSYMRDLLKLERLVKLELNHDDFTELKTRSRLADELYRNVRAMNAAAPPFLADGELAEITRTASAALDFYATTAERDGHFIGVMQKMISSRRSKKAMLVTGGFHSNGLERLLREKGYALVRVTPNIREIGRSEELYLNAMMGKTDASACCGEPESSAIMFASQLQDGARQSRFVTRADVSNRLELLAAATVHASQGDPDLLDDAVGVRPEIFPYFQRHAPVYYEAASLGKKKKQDSDFPQPEMEAILARVAQLQSDPEELRIAEMTGGILLDTNVLANAVRKQAPHLEKLIKEVSGRTITPAAFRARVKSPQEVPPELFIFAAAELHTGGRALIQQNRRAALNRIQAQRHRAIERFMDAYYNLLERRFVGQEAVHFAAGAAEIDAMRTLGIDLEAAVRARPDGDAMWARVRDGNPADFNYHDAFYVNEVLNREILIPNGYLFIFNQITGATAADLAGAYRLSSGRIRSEDSVIIQVPGGPRIQVPVHYVEIIRQNQEASAFYYSDRIVVFETEVDGNIENFRALHKTLSGLDRQLGRPVTTQELMAGGQTWQNAFVAAVNAQLKPAMSDPQGKISEARTAEVRSAIVSNLRYHEALHFLALYLNLRFVDSIGFLDANPQAVVLDAIAGDPVQVAAGLDQKMQTLLLPGSTLLAEYRAATGVAEKFAAVQKADETLTFLATLVQDPYPVHSAVQLIVSDQAMPGVFQEGPAAGWSDFVLRYFAGRMQVQGQPLPRRPAVHRFLFLNPVESKAYANELLRREFSPNVLNLAMERSPEKITVARELAGAASLGVEQHLSAHYAGVQKRVNELLEARTFEGERARIEFAPETPLPQDAVRIPHTERQFRLPGKGGYTVIIDTFDPKQTDISFLGRIEPSGHFRYDQPSKVNTWDGVSIPFSEASRRVNMNWQDLEMGLPAGRDNFTYSYHNMYWNDWFVVYNGIGNRLYRRDGEPVGARTYTTFVVWNDGRVSAENLRFTPRPDNDQRVYVHRADDAAKAEDLSDQIKFAVFGQQLIRQTPAGIQSVPIAELAVQFEDLFQLFRMPQFSRLADRDVYGTYGDPIGVQELMAGNVPLVTADDRPRLKQALERGGYTEIDLTPYITAEHTLADIKSDALAGQHLAPYTYSEIAPAAPDAMKSGDYFIRGNVLHIKLHFYPYPHNLVGVTEDGQAVSFVFTGDKTVGIGYPFSEIQEVARREVPGLVALFLLSNSRDAFRRINGRFQEVSGPQPYNEGTGMVNFSVPRRDVPVLGVTERSGIEKPWTFKSSVPAGVPTAAFTIRAPLTPEQENLLVHEVFARTGLGALPAAELPGLYRYALTGIKPVTGASLGIMNRRGFILTGILGFTAGLGALTLSLTSQLRPKIENPLLRQRPVREAYEDTYRSLLGLTDAKGMPTNQKPADHLVPDIEWFKSADIGFAWMADILAAANHDKNPIEGVSDPQTVTQRIRRSLDTYDNLVQKFGLRAIDPATGTQINTGILPEFIQRTPAGDYEPVKYPLPAAAKVGEKAVVYGAYDMMLATERLMRVAEIFKGGFIAGLEDREIAQKAARLVAQTTYAPFINGKNDFFARVYDAGEGKIEFGPYRIDNKHTEAKAVLPLIHAGAFGWPSSPLPARQDQGLRVWDKMFLQWDQRRVGDRMHTIARGDSGRSAFTEYYGNIYYDEGALAPSSEGISHHHYLTAAVEIGRAAGHRIFVSAPGTARTGHYREFGLNDIESLVAAGPFLALTTGHDEALTNVLTLIDLAKKSGAYQPGLGAGLPDSVDPENASAVSPKRRFINQGLIIEAVNYPVLRDLERKMPWYEAVSGLYRAMDTRHAAPVLAVPGSGKSLGQEAFERKGPSDAEIRTIVTENYDLGEVRSVTQLGGGVESLYFHRFPPVLVETSKGRFVFRKLGSSLAKSRYTVSFMNHLHAKGLPVPRVSARTRWESAEYESDKAIIRIGGEYFALEDYLEQGEIIKREQATVEHYRALGEMAAEIQNASRDFKPEGGHMWKERREIALSFNFGKFAELEAALRAQAGTAEGINESQHYFLDHAAEITALFREHLGYFLDTYTDDLRSKFADTHVPGASTNSHLHNDLLFKNVKFDDQGRIVGVFDFAAQQDHRIVEFNNMLLGDEDVETTFAFDPATLTAAVEAYQARVAVKLTPEEIQGIWEIARLRFLEKIYGNLFSRPEFNVLLHPERLPSLVTSLDNLRRHAPPAGKSLGTESRTESYLPEVSLAPFIRTLMGSRKSVRYADLEPTDGTFATEFTKLLKPEFKKVNGVAVVSSPSVAGVVKRAGIDVRQAAPDVDGGYARAGLKAGSADVVTFGIFPQDPWKFWGLLTQADRLLAPQGVMVLPLDWAGFLPGSKRYQELTAFLYSRNYVWREVAVSGEYPSRSGQDAPDILLIAYKVPVAEKQKKEKAPLSHRIEDAWYAFLDAWDNFVIQFSRVISFLWNYFYYWAAAILQNYEAVAEGLRSDQPRISSFAAEVLEKHPAILIRGYLRASHSSNWEVAAAAIASLHVLIKDATHSAAPDVLAEMQRVLIHGDLKVRSAAADLIGVLGNETTIAELKDYVLVTPYLTYSQVAAIWSIERLAARPELKPLAEAALLDLMPFTGPVILPRGATEESGRVYFHSEYLQMVTAEALARLKSQGAVEKVKLMLSHENGNVRDAGAKALIDLGVPEDDVARLRDELKPKQPVEEPPKEIDGMKVFSPDYPRVFLQELRRRTGKLTNGDLGNKIEDGVLKVEWPKEPEKNWAGEGAGEITQIPAGYPYVRFTVRAEFDARLHLKMLDGEWPVEVKAGDWETREIRVANGDAVPRMVGYFAVTNVTPLGEAPADAKVRPLLQIKDIELAREPMGSVSAGEALVASSLGSELTLKDKLKPATLHDQLIAWEKEGDDTTAPISVLHVAPQSLARYAEKVQQGFDGIARLPVQSETRIAGQDTAAFIAETGHVRADVTLIELHGAESEKPVAGGRYPGKNIVLIHRPEEVLLRYDQSRRNEFLANADAIVLLGNASVSSYEGLYPEKTVVAVPHGFFDTGSIDESRFTPGSIVTVGSVTSWGEMRRIEDAVRFVKEVRNAASGQPVLGYLGGPVDAKWEDLSRYQADPEVWLLTNEEMNRAIVSNGITDSAGLRKWLFDNAAGRTIVRAGMLPKENAASKWENEMLDFNLQFYREAAQNRNTAKVEYSGTLHSAAAPALYVVLDSPAMDDVQRDEAFRMVIVPIQGTTIDYVAGARSVASLITDSGRRRELLVANIESASRLGMREIAYGHYLVMKEIAGRSLGTASDSRLRDILAAQGARVDLVRISVAVQRAQAELDSNGRSLETVLAVSYFAGKTYHGESDPVRAALRLLLELDSDFDAGQQEFLTALESQPDVAALFQAWKNIFGPNQERGINIVPVSGLSAAEFEDMIDSLAPVLKDNPQKIMAVAYDGALAEDFRKRIEDRFKGSLFIFPSFSQGLDVFVKHLAGEISFKGSPGSESSARNFRSRVKELYGERDNVKRLGQKAILDLAQIYGRESDFAGFDLSVPRRFLDRGLEGASPKQRMIAQLALGVPLSGQAAESLFRQLPELQYLVIEGRQSDFTIAFNPSAYQAIMRLAAAMEAYQALAKAA